MSDYCKQCSIELFGQDYRELAGLSGSASCDVICEGCGPTIVDEDGQCISMSCQKHTAEWAKENKLEYCEFKKRRIKKKDI